jgi:hypothetical protein
MIGHLIHIGYPKTGSNFLRSWFAQHPQLAYAAGGIAGFPDIQSLVREGASQGGHPLYRVTSSEGLATPHSQVGEFGRTPVDLGEIRSMPIAQAKVCELLSNLFPTAQILIVTRGFQSMILSSYSQYVRTGGGESLAWLCSVAEEARPWNYDFLIGLYRKAFGASKVIFLPYELLRDDAAAFFGEIAKRLGLAEIHVPPGRPNPSLSPAELAWYPRLARRIGSLPLGASGRRKAWQLYLRAVMVNRLRTPIALLQRLRPIPPVLMPDVMEGFRGFATTLSDEPLYRAYAREYLFD